MHMYIFKRIIAPFAQLFAIKVFYKNEELTHSQAHQPQNSKIKSPQTHTKP